MSRKRDDDGAMDWETSAEISTADSRRNPNHFGKYVRSALTPPSSLREMHLQESRREKVAKSGTPEKSEMYKRTYR